VAGILHVVATPLGNLEDMTYRAVRVLGEVDVIAAEDTRTARRLLEHFHIGARPLVSYFEGNEAARTPRLVARLADGQSIALISEAGTPGVSDPGARLVAAAIAQGIHVEVVPGPVAAVTALVGSGLPTDRFLVLGFPPRDPGPRQAMLGALRAERATIVLYEAPGRVAATLADLVDALGADRRAALCRELTKVHEQIVRGSLTALRDRFSAAAPRGECTLVIAGATEDVRAIDVDAAMRALLAEGLGPRDAAARLVVKTGRPRRELYQLALSLAREGRP